MKKNKLVVLCILVVIILAGVAGFFYYKNKAKGIYGELAEPPKLFSKGDYVVEDRADGKYIVVPKVGLTAKVPTGWRVEFSNTAETDSTEYWVELLSPEANFYSLPKKGCKIDIMSTNSKDSAQNIVNIIEKAKIGQYNRNDEKFFKDYQYDVIKISGKDILRSTSPEMPSLGQIIELDFVNGLQKYTQVQVNFLPKYKEGCFLAWEDFVKNIVIK